MRFHVRTRRSFYRYIVGIILFLFAGWAFRSFNNSAPATQTSSTKTTTLAVDWASFLSFGERSAVSTSKPDQPNVFGMVVLETKRREALGKKGRELQTYLDGGIPTIGYGCHIKYLTPWWQALIKRQKGRVTEGQARLLMYQTFASLDGQIKAALPQLSDTERWAVKSLAYNYGWGNVRKSRLFTYLRSGERGDHVHTEWLRTWGKTESHRISRRMESALWHSDFSTAQTIAKAAFSHIQKRGDFAHY